MGYSDLVLDYKKEYRSTEELRLDVDSLFTEKYFSGIPEKKEKKQVLNFIPGDIYCFKYLTDSTISEKRKFINRYPLIVCLGSYDSQLGRILRGIDLICVPPEYRLKILERIYDSFTEKIEKNQPLPLTDENLSKLLKDTGYFLSVFGFKIKFIQELRVIDQEDWKKIPYLNRSYIEGSNQKEIYREYISKLNKKD